PAANSVAALALLRLAALTGEPRYASRAEVVLGMLAGPMAHHPGAFSYALAAADLLVTGPTEIAVVGDRPDLVSAIQARYLPNAVLAWGQPYPSPLWEGRSEGFAYVCRDYTCQAPVTDPENLLRSLRVQSGDIEMR